MTGACRQLRHCAFELPMTLIREQHRTSSQVPVAPAGGRTLHGRRCREPSRNLHREKRSERLAEPLTVIGEQHRTHHCPTLTEVTTERTACSASAATTTSTPTFNSQCALSVSTTKAQSELAAHAVVEMAERGGFEPPSLFGRLHDFESCRFNRAHAPLRGPWRLYNEPGAVAQGRDWPVHSLRARKKRCRSSRASASHTPP